MENIFTTVRPFYFMLKICGGFPMSFQGSVCKGLLKQNFVDTLVSIALFSTHLFAIIINSVRGDVVKSSSEILEDAWALSLIVCLCTLTLSFIYQILKRKSTVKFLSLIHDFDRKVKLINCFISVIKSSLPYFQGFTTEYSHQLYNASKIHSCNNINGSHRILLH